MITYTIIADLLTIIYMVIFIFYLIGWLKIPEFKTTEKVFSTKVCVVIPARNEEENIAVVLNSLLQQNYSKDFFEIIIVDDFSEDKTASVVKDYLQSNIRLIEMKNFINDKLLSNKKKSIETAIENTGAELIVTTDADCLMNENWLSTLVEFYETTNCKMIVAPVLLN
ncbi:MAG: glycosyltransferase, partial [Chitinophagales bacterium]|nr:glycosyltransferase [Chitinophagales bacterium]